MRFVQSGEADRVGFHETSLHEHFVRTGEPARAGSEMCPPDSKGLPPGAWRAFYLPTEGS